MLSLPLVTPGCGLRSHIIRCHMVWLCPSLSIWGSGEADSRLLGKCTLPAPSALSFVLLEDDVLESVAKEGNLTSPQSL